MDHKAIFLDFDGVIRIPVPSGGPRIEAEFCDARMKRVARLAEETGAKIVISSDWRHRYDYAGMTKLLKPHISEDLFHTDWKTPTLASAASDLAIDMPIPRGAEILCWLARNPEIGSFVILDDMHSKNFPLMVDRLVTCQLLDGFTEERYEKARLSFLAGY